MDTNLRVSMSELEYSAIIIDDVAKRFYLADSITGVTSPEYCARSVSVWLKKTSFKIAVSCLVTLYKIVESFFSFCKLKNNLFVVKMIWIILPFTCMYSSLLLFQKTLLPWGRWGIIHKLCNNFMHWPLCSGIIVLNKLWAASHRT